MTTIFGQTALLKFEVFSSIFNMTSFWQGVHHKQEDN